MKHENNDKPEKDGQPEAADVLKAKEQECAAVQDKYVRLCAEFDNARKRWGRDREELIKFANFSLLQEMLVVVDELEHAIKVCGDAANAAEILKGVQMIYGNTLSLLKKNGVSPIDTKGKRFDPHLHEIVASREADGLAQHEVIEEVQKGYMLEDKVLRTSKVIVAVVKETEVVPAADDGEEVVEEGEA